MGKIRAAKNTGQETKKGSEKMSEIIERKDSQELFVVEQDTAVFSCGSEIHSVTIKINQLDVELSIHSDSDGVSKPRIRIHGLNDSELTIFQKVSKKFRKLATGTVWTKIKGLKA